MAVKIKGIRKLQIAVKKKFLTIQKDKKMLKEIAEFSVDRIKAFARSSKPMREGKKDRFPTVKPGTANSRKRVAKYNNTHSTYKQSGKGKNLTITGQLIEATKFKIKGSIINIFVKGRRTLYRGKDGKPYKNQERDSGKIYDKLTRRDRDYAFLGMDEAGEKRIRNIIKRNLRRLLK